MRDFARRFFFVIIGWPVLLMVLVGCASVREPQVPRGPHFRVLTYNVNWGVPGPDAATEIIRQSNADIICLQETTSQWADHLRATLSDLYPWMEFRQSVGRMGGGLAFLSKQPGSEVAYIASSTGWFDGWIMAFETAAGPVQVLNVHLQPPVGKRGYFNASGYLFTGDDRLKEIQRFYPTRRPGLPTLVIGDFNDSEETATVEWLKEQGFHSALSEFDRRTPTWEWRSGPIKLRRRMDHILYPDELTCCAAEVIREGASDHFPVSATFQRGM